MNKIIKAILFACYLFNTGNITNATNLDELKGSLELLKPKLSSLSQDLKKLMRKKATSQPQKKPAAALNDDQVLTMIKATLQEPLLITIKDKNDNELNVEDFMQKSDLKNIVSLKFQQKTDLFDLENTWKSLPNLKTVGLSRLELKNIPKQIFDLKNLIHLDLSYNEIESIPNEISKLATHLENLNLVANKISNIPQEMLKLTKLTSLDLSSNNLTKIPDSIGKLTELTDLDLSDNKLTELPQTIGNLSNLKKLFLNNNNLTNLPSSIKKLTRLDWLTLADNNQLKWEKQQKPAVQFVEWISQLENIKGKSGKTKLENKHHLSFITPATLTNITTLDLSNNKLTEIPRSISELTKLTSLYLSDNNLTKIPDSIGQLKGLKRLHLSNNNLTELPQTIEKLSKLKYLFLNNNNLTNLPAGIKNLTQLAQLKLADNNQLKWDKQTEPAIQFVEWISQLESIKGQSGSTKLENKHHLSFITPATLNKISDLDLSNNKLTQIPSSISELTKLTSLDLSDNKLTELPQTIGQLKELTTLHLSNNNLAELPDSIENLSKLAILYLNNNNLTNLPSSIKKLDQLSQLNLADNKTLKWETQQQPAVQFVEWISRLVNIKGKSGSTKLEELRNRSFIAPATLKNITDLDLSNNKLTEIPRSISELTQLTSLNLSNNNLTQIPDSISELTKLTYLNLSNNTLAELPQTIGQLKELKRLDLSNNNLAELSETVKKIIGMGFKENKNIKNLYINN